MYKVIVLAAMLVLGAQILCATACITTTADFYVANYGGSSGCTIGLLMFSNFKYSIVGASTPVDPAGGLPSNEALITPLIDINGVGYSFTPTVTWDSLSTGNSDVELQYIMTAIGPFTQITGIYDEANGTIAGSNSPPNSAFLSVLDVYCPGGTSLPPATPCPGFGSVTPQIDSDINFGSTQTVTHASFPAVTTIAVLKDMDANSATGANPGTATFTSIKNQFDVITPEPGTVALFGGGLMAVWLARRHRRA